VSPRPCAILLADQGSGLDLQFTGTFTGTTDNLPPPDIFPDYRAPIVRNRPEGRGLAVAR
jgi:hypothetical protein